MVSEIERCAKQTLVRRDIVVVFVRSYDVQGHLDLGQTLVQIHGRTIRVESGPRRNHVIFCSADCPLRSVRAFGEWGHEIPFDVELLGHLQQGPTLLVVHSYLVEDDPMSAKEFHSLSERHRGVLVTQAEQRLDIDVSSMATDLEVSCA
jgi:hypothetical protein